MDTYYPLLARLSFLSATVVALRPLPKHGHLLHHPARTMQKRGTSAVPADGLYSVQKRPQGLGRRGRAHDHG